MDDENRGDGYVWLGILIAMGLYMVQAAVVLGFGDRAEVPLDRFLSLYIALPPFTQLIYIVPLALLLRREKPMTSSGLWGGAIVMGGINLALYGLFNSK